MTAKKKTPTGKKLKVKKETLKDLDAKRRAEDVKGGFSALCKAFCPGGSRLGP